MPRYGAEWMARPRATRRVARTCLFVAALLLAAASLPAQDAVPPPPPEGAVVRVIVKEADAERLTLKILQVDRTNDRGQFERVSGQLIPKVSPSSLLWNKPEEIVKDAILKIRMIGAEQGGDVLEVKAPGSYSAEEALPVAERFAKARVRVKDEIRDPQHFFVTDILTMETGDFQLRWGQNPAGSVFPIDPETLERDVRAAVGIGTELELELGPKGIVKATVLSGGVAETKAKGVWLGVGAVLSIVVLIIAWIVLRKKLLGT